jgi:hypothetical protein
MGDIKASFEALGGLLKAFGKAFADQLTRQMRDEFLAQIGSSPFGARKSALDRLAGVLDANLITIAAEDRDRLLFEVQRARTAVDTTPLVEALSQAVARAPWADQAIPKLAFWQAISGSQQVNLQMSGPPASPPATGKKARQRTDLRLLAGGKGEEPGPGSSGS